jgi:phosphopantothenoylcysteine decarboxylase/phosphopantothenate--cysteine ligase
MPEPETILAHIGRLVQPESILRGKRILVTAGPTREAIDPVRYISNNSSGRMGVAIAAAAWRRGAHVDLVAGHSSLATPTGVARHDVESVSDMRREVEALLPQADALVMAAAPADFRPAASAGEKIKKHSAPNAIALAPTDDILLATKGARRAGAVIVGFALETNDVIANGRTKLESKDLDMIVANDATENGAGFGVDTNRVTMLHRDGREERLPLMSKADVADAILDRVEQVMRGR